MKRFVKVYSYDTRREIHILAERITWVAALDRAGAVIHLDDQSTITTENTADEVLRKWGEALAPEREGSNG